jgi:hypothetical protein
MTKFGEPSHSPAQPERSRLRLWVQQHVNYPYDDCCLIWPFGRHRDGYGTLIVDGGMTYAHRYMCRLVHGEPPTPEHEASHSCNRGHDACVSPHHLSWKTPGENHKEGEWHQKIKINADQAREIRDLKGLEVASVTAERFGIAPVTVRQIQAGRIWRTDKRRGTNHFTDEQVLRIRSLKDSGQTQALADEFGVSYLVIYRIMNRQTWQHVPDVL